MSEAVINQKSSMSSNTDQIAIQNNYYGMSSQDASNLAIQLFMDNFPKLQQQAIDIAKKRAEELVYSIIDKVSIENDDVFSAFSDPDVQCVLLESQKSYARIGSSNKLGLISDLLSTRIIKNNEETIFKIVLDKAIEIVPFLSDEQLDFISLLFMCSRVKFNNIKTIDDLERHYKYITSAFSKSDGKSYAYLNTLGCLQLWLFNPVESAEEKYELKKDDIEKICPNIIKNLDGDYSTSPVGSIIAMIYIENKTNYKFDLKSFLY